MIKNIWACSRNTSEIIENKQTNSTATNSTSTYTVLWQNHGGNIDANNVVNDQLPTGVTLSEVVKGAPETGYTMHAAPVIYSDDASNQFIFVLYAKSGTLQLIKIDYANGTLTQSSTFQPIAFESGPPYKAHQIAIGHHNESIAVYVAHHDGLSKINALTGDIMGTFQNQSIGYRVLVDGNTIYFQDKTNLTQLDATTFNQNPNPSPLISPQRDASFLHNLLGVSQNSNVSYDSNGNKMYRC